MQTTAATLEAAHDSAQDGRERATSQPWYVVVMALGASRVYTAVFDADVLPREG